MLQSMDSNFFLILAVLVFTAVMLLLEGGYLMWRAYKGPEAKQIEKRLRALSAAHDHSAQAALLRERMMSDLPLLQRLLYSLPRMHVLDRMLLQADVRWTVSRLLLTCAAVGTGMLLLCWMLLAQPFLFSLGIAAVFSLLPFLYVRRKRARRMAKMERQLPDALDLLCRALLAGHAFSSGLQMIGEEMHEPIASEFAAVADEVNYGVSLQQALTNLAERVPITDLRYFVVSVLIQRDSGGNLTELLTNLSQLIRARLKLMARIKVLSSEGRLSAWILGLMPFALGAVMTAGNREFMTPMWEDPIGISIVRTMLITMAIGIIVLKKITKIRV
jgi:tight adherence protein B